MDKNKKIDLGKEIAKVKKREKLYSNMVDGCSMFAAISAGAFVTSLIIGGAAAATAELNYKVNENSYQIRESDEFQVQAREQSNALTNAFLNGEISYDQFKVEYNKIYSKQGVVEFAKKSSNENLNEFADSYENAEDVKNVVLGKGLPTLATMTTAGILGASYAAYAEMKNKNKHRVLIDKMEENEEEMSR